MKYLISLFFLFTLSLKQVNADPLCPDSERVRELVTRAAYQDLKPCAESNTEIMASLYPSADSNLRTRLANGFYQLGVKSENARAALMQDMKTHDPELRLAVQWALGRVSNDDVVVQSLLDNMRNDPNPLFRDKAACALAYDQIHLTEPQKVRLYAGLIDGLEDEKEDVRRISALALQIKTGQTKDYNPNGFKYFRSAAVTKWREWLEEYRSQLQVSAK